MAVKKYRVLETSFINGRLVQPGDVVEFNGDAGSNLALVEDEKPSGKKSKAAAPGADQQPEDGAEPVI